MYTFDEQTLSDLHKDARGSRPRSDLFWDAWNEADNDGKQANSGKGSSLLPERAGQAACLPFDGSWPKERLPPPDPLLKITQDNGKTYK